MQHPGRGEADDGGLTANELAIRAGVPEEFVERLAALGILAPDGGPRPYRRGDIRRVRLAQACEEADLGVDAIGQTIRAGKLSFAFLDLPSFRWGEREAQTYAELSEESGLPLDLLGRLHEGVGFAPPAAEDHVRPDDRLLLPIVKFALATGIDEPMMMRLLRVYGESFRRITEAETQLYHSRIELPMLESGSSQRQMLEAATQWGAAVVPQLDQVLLALYHRYQERTWVEDLIEHIESALEEAGLHRRLERPPAMCFLDLAGYTRLTEERGDAAAADVASSLAHVVQGTSREHGGVPVKWLGDGVMIYFSHPEQAVTASLDLAERIPNAGLPPVHVGIDAGPLIHQEGDYYGRTVNVAARIGAYAGPHQVLVSDRVVEVASAPEFREIGAVELKGLIRPVNLYEALRPA